ncbi:MAG: hypothetical protein JWR90_508 [Marmoricola sp.]|nr:hypothetical protein [Marmoricola sp.]
MDLSAIIFVVLALAWAVYLIPKALKHHDELASDRLVEGHSDKVRILSRRSSAGTPEVVEVEVEHTDTVEKTSAAPPVAGPIASPIASPIAGPIARPLVTRASARRAAQRRRRVLGALLLLLAVVWGLDWLAYVPFWSPVAPAALVVAWLVLARLSVRRQTARRSTSAAPTTAVPVVATQTRVHVEAPAKSQDLVDLLTEDTTGLQRDELEAALAKEGSLWDPLPLTLPTYVNKARARRTVRTIELTGINSSGHDQADTALAREAAEATGATEDGDPGQRKVAGA